MSALVHRLGIGLPGYPALVSGGAALVIGMLGFVSTAALAKFLLRGEVIE